MLLGFSDPLHFREVRYSGGPTERVLVFYLPDRQFGFHAKRVKKEVSERQRRDERDTAQHPNTQQTWKHGMRRVYPEK